MIKACLIATFIVSFLQIYWSTLLPLPKLYHALFPCQKISANTKKNLAQFPHCSTLGGVDVH